MAKQDLNLLDVMVDIGEGFAKARKTGKEEKNGMCMLAQCIEDSEYAIEYEDGKRIYLCKEHFDYLKTNTLAYVAEDIRENANKIWVTLNNEKKVTVLYFGKLEEIQARAGRYAVNMGLLDNEEELEPEIFLSVVRALDGIAYVDVLDGMVFGYCVDDLGDEGIVTPKEWEETMQRLEASEI